MTKREICERLMSIHNSAMFASGCSGVIGGSPCYGVGNAIRELILDIVAEGFQVGDAPPVRLGGVVDQGRDHPDLSFLGPGDKRVLFAWHITQQYLKELTGSPARQGIIRPVKACGPSPGFQNTVC